MTKPHQIKLHLLIKYWNHFNMFCRFIVTDNYIAFEFDLNYFNSGGLSTIISNAFLNQYNLYNLNIKT